jgi:hypothetical protein
MAEWSMAAVLKTLIGHCSDFAILRTNSARSDVGQSERQGVLWFRIFPVSTRSLHLGYTVTQGSVPAHIPVHDNLS